MFECVYCDRLHVEGGLTLQNGPFVNLHPWRSKDVVVQDMTISNPIDSPNTDCIDPHSVVNMLVRNTTFYCGDDHIAIKASNNTGGPGGETREELEAASGVPSAFVGDDPPVKMPTVNFTARNCTFYWGQGLTIGSRVHGDVLNTTFEDILMVGSLSGPRLKAVRSEGGVIDTLTFRRMELHSVAIMFSIDMAAARAASSPRRASRLFLDARRECPTQDFHHDGVESDTPPVYSNVLFQNITGWGDLAGVMDCLPESPCADVRLESVFAENTSEVVLPYVASRVAYLSTHIEEAPQVSCKHLTGTCTDCGSWPALCDEIARV